MGKYFKKKLKKKRSAKPFIIIGVILGVIALIAIIILIIAQIKKKMVPTYEAKTDITIELNSKQPDIKDLFVTYKYMKDNMVEVNWDELDVTKKGTYNIPITITIDDKKDERIIIATVADTTMPDIKLKIVTITEGEKYNLSDFIESCNDNSTVCNPSFNEDSFASITAVGEHKIQIKAVDDSGNTVIRETTLIIKKKETTPTPDPKPVTPTCAYGSLTPNQANIPLAYSVAKDNNNCPIDRNLLLNNGQVDHSGGKLPSYITKALENISKSEIEKIQKEIVLPNATKATAVLRTGVSNIEGTGIVGFGIRIIVYVDETATVSGEALQDSKYIKEDYYVKEDGTRVYSVNKYNLK